MINNLSKMQKKRKKKQRTQFLLFIFLGSLACFAVNNARILLKVEKKIVSEPISIKKYDTVSCPEIISLSKKEGIYDPNKDLPESPKKLTVTEPTFWISLFTQWYDQQRWNSIYKKGYYYEVGLTNIFKEILSVQNKSPGRVLDVGMNIGWYSLWSRAFGHTVVSFEPNPVMHVRVCESLILNGWDKDKSVQLFKYGVGNEEAEMALTTGKNPGGSSFFSERLTRKYRKTMPVKVVKLDNIAEQEGWLSEMALPIHLMKIDVEGFEYFSLLGAKKILNSGKVTNIIVENSSTDGNHVVALLDLLYHSGYKVYALLGVDGEPYHNDEKTLASVNEAISKVTPSIDPKDFSHSWLIKVTNNIWWKKRVK